MLYIIGEGRLNNKIIITITTIALIAIILVGVFATIAEAFLIPDIALAKKSKHNSDDDDTSSSPSTSTNGGNSDNNGGSSDGGSSSNSQSLTTKLCNFAETNPKAAAAIAVLLGYPGLDTAVRAVCVFR
jgi:hypothetical protein